MSFGNSDGKYAAAACQVSACMYSGSISACRQPLPMREGPTLRSGVRQRAEASASLAEIAVFYSKPRSETLGFQIGGSLGRSLSSVTGKSRTRMPQALWIALATAAPAPEIPSSPMPLAWIGLAWMSRSKGSVEDTCENPHGSGDEGTRARLVISPTMPRLARPAILD